jgi:solute carrier family 12 sodium/potassium/chloride transporter 2
MYKANTVQYHVKNYAPNIMVLSGDPESRKELVSLAHLITNNNGLQMCINVNKVSLFIYLFIMYLLPITYVFKVNIKH